MLCKVRKICQAKIHLLNIILTLKAARFFEGGLTRKVLLHVEHGERLFAEVRVRVRETKESMLKDDRCAVRGLSDLTVYRSVGWFERWIGCHIRGKH